MCSAPPSASCCADMLPGRHIISGGCSMRLMAHSNGSRRLCCTRTFGTNVSTSANKNDAGVSAYSSRPGPVSPSPPLLLKLSSSSLRSSFSHCCVLHWSACLSAALEEATQCVKLL
eukprot:CAMPEP_0173247728 /NCGR_PEP_ID=MMETSP1142-20121109/18054_1 /TAXON_ID=483371 /ORGANISM="non described non described, Strain CCMP2298" /LENGTH=115 /DNA_ID=CAMNT_0014180135 /DNA_START=46 /DNA_END=396 /DNA_ORIENTATION=+